MAQCVVANGAAPIEGCVKIVEQSTQGSGWHRQGSDKILLLACLPSSLQGLLASIFGHELPHAIPKCEAANAVEALDPGVPYESRWAPYARAHGPEQGQFPKGSIRPRGYMAPDARRSLAFAM